MGYPIDGIAMAVLGGILSAIFCGGRNGRNPGLSVHPLRQGGLQIAALVVSLIFSIVFGCITGFILRFTGS
jgi:ammonia channel protein AmtB